MPKYTVIITRDITESATFSVEASDAEAAETAALDKMYQSQDTEWEIDDGSWNQDAPYVTDVREE